MITLTHCKYIGWQAILFVLCMVPNLNSSQEINVDKSKPTFKEVFEEFPRQQKNLRKWDAPIVVDLDQDGYLDLIINDHGYGVQVCWNNKGRYAEPYDIIMGDIHGVSVGDIDMDGNLEVIMSRGGGSGSNARNSKLYSVGKQRKFIELEDFKEPLALMRGRTVAFIDGDNDGDLDLLNFAFPAATKKGESENYVYENNGEGELILHSVLPAIISNGQKTLVTDINGDNVLDIILYGNGPIKAYEGKGDLTYKEVSKKVFPKDIEDVTSIVELDFDNDGDFDLFFTRGKEFNKGETFYNKKTKTLGFFTKRGKFIFNDLEAGDVLNLENFQSQWPNNDTYFIGETSYDYKFEGETHSGKDIRLVNSDALGYPDNPDYQKKKGWYIGYVGNRKWRIAGFLWAPATGVVHGVEHYEDGSHSEGFNDILLENTGNRFKDVTKELNLLNKAHTMEATVADFDNNGYQDLLLVKRGELVYENESIVYLNKNGSGFDQLNHHGIVSKELGAIGMAVETIDYDKNGKVDVVIGNDRGKWHLFKNELDDADTKRYMTIEVGYSLENNVSPLGAKVTLEFCEGTLVQRVGSTGAQYSLSHNNFMHFGLGTCPKPVKVVVEWTNGERLEKKIKSSDSNIKMGNKNNGI